MSDLDLYIEDDGTMQFVYSDDMAGLLGGLGDATTRRASHVEPCGTGWSADMSPVGGPVLLDNGRPFSTREAALKAELAWLDSTMTSRAVTFAKEIR